VLERVPFVEGYGVDLALVIDIANQFGMTALAQVDLGRRDHRNRPLSELAPQAEVVLRAGLQRAGVIPRPHWPPVLVRPPMIEVAAYRASA
jgi:glucosyl-3-phosphoglycerate synthase